jgi:myosin heavy subunit
VAAELAAARSKLDVKVALSSKADEEAAQLKQAAEAATAELQQERDRSATLTSELAKVRSELEAKVALSSKAGDEAAQLRQSLQQERQREAALSSELAAAHSELDRRAALSNADEEAAHLTQVADAAKAELQKERNRSAALASELAKVRSELEARVTLASKAGDEAAQLRQAAEELRQSLAQGRQREAVLSSELAAARSELDTRLASSKADEQAAQQPTAELRRSLQQEQKVPNLTRDVDAARGVIEARIMPEPTTSGQVGHIKPVAEPVAPEQPAATKARATPEAARLMARASTLLAQGNIGAARIVLERAAETGSAEASFALAETYDPRILSSWGTFGTRGDGTKAREFYAKAIAGGIQQGKDRLNASAQ